MGTETEKLRSHCKIQNITRSSTNMSFRAKLRLAAVLSTFLLFAARGSAVVCGSLTSCSACNAHPECSYCQDAEDAVKDPTESLGGWVFRENGLDGAEGRNEIDQIDTVSNPAPLYDRLHQEAAANAQLLQQQRSSSHHQRHARLLLDNQRGDRSSTSGGGEAAVLAFLDVASTAHRPSNADAIADAAGNPVDTSAVQTARSSSSAASSAAAPLLGVCVNASFASLHSMCSDLRTSVCDCDDADVDALPECRAVVDDLQRPFYVIAAAFVAALVVVGTTVALELFWRRQGRSTGCLGPE